MGDAVTFADDSILVLLDTTPAGELAKSSAGLLGGVPKPAALPRRPVPPSSPNPPSKGSR